MSIKQQSERLAVSFSMGETSALMAALIAKKWADKYKQIIYLCANTGEEYEQSLEFGEYVNQTFLGGNLVWVEAVVRHNERRSCGHRVVDFHSATRGPQIFEDMARKYGIPNQDYPHCTRSLKLDPITSYLREIGWEAGTYDTAVGIRRDEIDRMSENAAQNRIIYPLISAFPVTKKDVNEFWADQPVRLNLKSYQGNCKWCWKKTFRKHYTLITEDPSAYDTPRMLEAKYAHHGAGDDRPRRLFRKYKTVADIEREAARGFYPYHDENTVYNDPELDLGGGCGDSCEVWADL